MPASDTDVLNPASATLSRSLSGQISRKLGERILDGQLLPGQLLPDENALCDEFGVSRTAVREAVKMLTAKGLLSARPRQGTIVQPSSNWNLFDPDVLRWLLERRSSVELLRQFNQLRIAIEPEAAALASRFHGEDELAGISAGLTRMREAEKGNDDTLTADIAFHVAILEASGNPFYRQFRDVVSTALHTSIRLTNNIKGHSASIADHACVMDAIAKRDEDGARRAMRHLIGEVLELIDQESADAPA